MMTEFLYDVVDNRGFVYAKEMHMNIATMLIRLIFEKYYYDCDLELTLRISDVSKNAYKRVMMCKDTTDEG